jgi:hypothetical protein
MEKRTTEMENKMDENKEEKKKSMKELQNSMSSLIIQTLDEKLHKEDIKIPGTHENKVSSHVEQPADNKKFSSGFILIVELIMVGVLNSTFTRLN